MNTNTPTKLGMGDLARSINCATELLAADTAFIKDATPAQLADTMGLIVAEYLRVTAELADEFGITPDTGGGARKGFTPSPQSSPASNGSSAAPSPTPAPVSSGPVDWSAGNLKTSPKQGAFFEKVVKQAGAASPYTVHDIYNAASYDERNQIVDAIKVAAGYTL